MASLIIAGDTSGTVKLEAATVAGSNTITVPAQTGTMITTASTSVVTPAMLTQPNTMATSQASTSGTTVEFTGIPSWVKRITVMLNGVSLSGTDDILVQLGVSGNYTATYASTGAAVGAAGSTAISASTTGFVIRSAAAASITSGTMTICNLTGNVWVASHACKQSTTAVQAGGGDVSLGGTVTSIRLTTTTTNTFDGGSVNIVYEV